MPEGGPAPTPAVRTRATWLLIALRTAYAYNWFSIGPALPGIGAAFGVGPAEWGLLLAAFLLGAGTLQVPAGLLARRFGPRRVALLGAGLLALGGLASALAPSFAFLFAMRLAAGVGAGLFFSPAIGLVGSLYPAGERGVPVGVFSSAFSGGAAVGVFATAVLIPHVGWREAVAFGALGLGLLTLLTAAWVPREVGARPPTRRAGGRVHAWRLRGVWVIGVAFVGFEGASFATGQFVVPWGEALHGWTAFLAGAVGASFVLPSVVGGPVGGVAAERTRRPRRELAVATGVAGALLVLLPWAGLGLVVAIGCGFSFAYGFVYAVMYVLPHRWPELPAEEIPLAIGLFNGLQLGGGALVALAFGWVVAHDGYAVAWPYVGAVQVVALLSLLALPVRAPAARPPAAEASALP